MSEWIKCSEMMPKHGDHVLVWVRFGHMYIARYNSASVKFICDEYIQCIDVTHWMPLPEPPKE